MAKFVGAALCTHIPRLFILDPAARKAYMGDEVTTMYEAMESMYAERIAPLDVDTFIIVDTHWFSTIDYILNANERLSGSYTSEELPDMIHDYEYDYRGDPELADWIAEVGAKNNVRVNACHYKTLPIHYPSLTTMRYLNPKGTARVLSVSVCQSAELHNDLAFGRAVGEAVATLPGERRVVFLAAGGMSHKFNPYDVILPKAGANPDNITTPAEPRMGRAHPGPVGSGSSCRRAVTVHRIQALSIPRRPLGALPEHGRRPRRRVLHRARHALRDLRGRARDGSG